MTPDEAESLLQRIAEGDPLNQVEVALCLGTSHQRVHQLEHGALRKLRGALGYLGRAELRDALQAWSRARDARA